MLLLFWAAGNRDPDKLEQPDAIRLDRPRRHLAFGRGIHTCIGAPLARLEATVVLRAILERTRSITLDPRRPPRWVRSLQVRRYDQLFVNLEPA